MATTDITMLPDPSTGESGKSELDVSNLKEGEFLCDVCNGTGLDPKYDIDKFYRPVCPKCQGEKKLDWISIATGIKPKPIMGSSSGSSMSALKPDGSLWSVGNNAYGKLGTSSCGISTDQLSLTTNEIEIDGKSFEDYMVNILSEKLAEKIDKQIVESIKNVKKNKTKKWRNFFDNRIFSKLMFFCNFKQRIKNKKDKITL